MCAKKENLECSYKKEACECGGQKLKQKSASAENKK